MSNCKIRAVIGALLAFPLAGIAHAQDSHKGLAGAREQSLEAVEALSKAGPEAGSDTAAKAFEFLTKYKTPDKKISGPALDLSEKIEGASQSRRNLLEKASRKPAPDAARIELSQEIRRRRQELEKEQEKWNQRNFAAVKRQSMGIGFAAAGGLLALPITPPQIALAGAVLGLIGIFIAAFGGPSVAETEKNSKLSAERDSLRDLENNLKKFGPVSASPIPRSGPI